MRINTDFLVRCINTLESAVEQLQQREPADPFCDTFREASVKEFEIVLEQSGILLKRRLRPYFASNRQADRLTFKNIFRHAAKHDLISLEACERWFAYRDNRNDTAHDCGEDFAETTLKLLPDFIADARNWRESWPKQGMTDRLELPLRYRRELEALLREHVPDAEVWAYGSRVSGESHPASDLDLVLRGPNLEPLGHRFSDLLEALEDSNIPILIQAHDWARLPKTFHREIERDYVALVNREERTTEFRQTAYGRFPADFSEDSLANLCESKNGVQTGPFGSQLHQRDYVPVGTPIITVEHLGENRILHQDLPYVSDQDRERLNKYSLRSGDIVFSRVGSVDRRALVRRTEEGWLFSGRCLRVRPHQKKIDPAYLSYFFGLPTFPST